MSRYCTFSVHTKQKQNNPQKKMCTKIIYFFKRLHGQILYRVWGLIIRHPFSMGLNKTKKHFSKLDRLFNILYSDGLGDTIVKHTEISTGVYTVR